ncbi:MAG: hypothetical protein MJ016_05600 [Victivallaceae bacterium]|nr:hypothetical protein [Victivallaceae bacterium]
MTEKRIVTIDAIEKAVAECGARFTVAAAAKKCGDASAAMRDRIYRILDGDGRCFSETDAFVRREAFFDGRSFLVTPDEWEIGEGILMPGHRFAPFVSGEVFPSEVDLRIGGKPVAKKTITLPLGKLFHSHLLLGSEQLFDFLVAENPANAHLRRSRSGGEAVTLDVFDLADFYRGHKFAAGDALSCRIADFGRGALDATFASAETRSAAARKKAIGAIDAALGSVYDRFEEYLDIPEELAWAFFFARSASPETAVSLDEYVQRSSGMEIRTDDGHAVLVPVDRLRRDEDDGEAGAVPDFLSISGGETGDFGAILRSIGSTYSPAETDAFILDAGFRRCSDFDLFFREFFGASPFADEAQKEIFRTMLEERFEELLGVYDRAADESKAPLRRDILDAVEERQAFFDFLAESGKSLSADEKRLVNDLAAVSRRLGEALKTLGAPGELAASDAEELENSVGRELELFDRAMDKLNDQIERK